VEHKDSDRVAGRRRIDHRRLRVGDEAKDQAGPSIRPNKNPPGYRAVSVTPTPQMLKPRMRSRWLTLVEGI